MISIATPIQRPSKWIDLLVMLFLAALLYGLIQFGRHLQTPLQTQVNIHLSLFSLPKYAFLSLLRASGAYILSLLFTLAYGYTAAHVPRADRVMIPLLDILQSIPVLGFLPGIALTLMRLFPNTNMGLELSSILMIFTGQVWNMTFSFYQSIRTIPAELNEAASIYQFSKFQRLLRVEIPASAVGLAWNSMMSMAGGWFFLMICETFRLSNHDFRLPGLGSYMSAAVEAHNVPAIIAGMVTMVLLIIFLDTLVWKPLIVWVQKFRLGDAAAVSVQKSRVLGWIERSPLLTMRIPNLGRKIAEILRSKLAAKRSGFSQNGRRQRQHRVIKVILILVSICLLILMLDGAWGLFKILIDMPLDVWGSILKGAALTLLRVAGAVLLASLWTIPVGIWIGKSKQHIKRFQPIVQVAASFPAPMLYPLVLIALNHLGWGLGVGSFILMWLGVQWYILFNVIAGASQVAPEFREVAQVYGFNRRQRWMHIWWPATFPFLVTGWITATGGAWNASIVAEYATMGNKVYTTHGLGSMISIAASEGNYQVLAAGILVMVLVVVLINRLLWKPLYRLAEGRYSM